VLKAPTETTTNIGAVGQIFIQQDGTGSRTLSYNTVFQFPGASVPVLSTAANAVDTLFYAVRTATKVDAILVKNFNRS
jgi:D-alanyl-D-alanine carboxypeptidase